VRFIKKHCCFVSLRLLLCILYSGDAFCRTDIVSFVRQDAEIEGATEKEFADDDVLVEEGLDVDEPIFMI